MSQQQATTFIREIKNTIKRDLSANSAAKSATAHQQHKEGDSKGNLSAWDCNNDQPHSKGDPTSKVNSTTIN